MLCLDTQTDDTGFYCRVEYILLLLDDGKDYKHGNTQKHLTELMLLYNNGIIQLRFTEVKSKLIFH